MSERRSSFWLFALLLFLSVTLQAAGAWINMIPSTTSKHHQTSHGRRRYISMTTESTAAAAASTKKSTNPRPNLPLPDAICSNVPGTWAYDTMSRRVNQDILELTVQDCATDLAKPEFASIKSNIDALRNELSHAATTKLTPLEKPDDDNDDAERTKEWDEWNRILQPHIDAGDTWLTAPWMVTEFYVYRRLMQCFDYWNAASAGYQYDPFVTQKQNGLVSSVGNAEPALLKMQNILPMDDTSTSSSSSVTTGLTLATQLALWGNKMDLSLWPADVDAADTDVFSGILEAAVTNLLHDDSHVLADYCQTLRERGTACVDIIVDNAGFELVTDLALAQYLVESGIAKQITFQLKSHPTFVSDALEKDLLETVNYYADSLDAARYPACVAAGKKWRQLLQDGRWKCVEDNFWVQPFAMWDMTEPLRSDLVNRCDLAFVKGDANYRRLLGDRKWELTADFADVVGCYFPVPVCALRTLKAEIGCGMDAPQVERAAALDENWMTNGRFGVVQYGRGAGK
jgi:Damage-control phosphatase ARMT1-like domain